MDSEIRPITALRFVAALFVFLFHIHIRWPLAEAGPVAAIISQGAIGMSLFFVLSGFILTYRYHNHFIDCRSFSIHRVARIAPIYLLAALVTIPWLITPAVPAPTEYHRYAQYIFLVVTNLTFLQAWFPQTFPFWNDGGSWSISVEAFFYALFPWILPTVKRQTSAAITYIALCSWALSILPGLSFLLFIEKPQFTLFYAMPIFRLPEFVMGVMIGVVFVRKTVTVTWPTFVIGVVTCVLAAYLALSEGRMPAWLFVCHNWIVLPSVSLVILCCATLSRGWLALVLSSPPLVYLGRISYSFYSMQALLMLSLTDNRDALVERFPLLHDNWVLSGAAFIALTSLSACAYHLVEEPARKYISRRLGFQAGLVSVRASLPPVD